MTSELAVVGCEFVKQAYFHWPIELIAGANFHTIIFRRTNFPAGGNHRIGLSDDFIGVIRVAAQQRADKRRNRNGCRASLLTGGIVAGKTAGGFGI